MLPAMKAIAQRRAAGLKPPLVEIHLTGKAQFPFWRHSDQIPDVALPLAPDVSRMDFRVVVGCVVILYADSRTDTLRRVVRRLVQVASVLTVVVFDELPAKVGYEWQKGRGWREVCGGAA